MTREQIENTMIDIGIPSNHKGFLYLLEMLLLMQETKRDDWNFNKMYETLAERHGVKHYTVLRRINSEFVYLRNFPKDSRRFDMIDLYVGFDEDSPATTISRFYTMLDRNNENPLKNDESMKKMIKEVVREVLKELIT